MNSFLLSFPDTQADATELRETIAHETVHNWISSIGGPPGTTLWFSEGMTVHYTRELLFRSGLFTAEEYLDSVNDTAANYYTNPLNDLPNEDIAAGFWKDARIRRLPYVRGSFYFADVDARIRERSDGERSLDDLVTEIIAIRSAGAAVRRPERTGHDADARASARERGIRDRVPAAGRVGGWLPVVPVAGRLRYRVSESSFVLPGDEPANIVRQPFERGIVRIERVASRVVVHFHPVAGIVGIGCQ
jgi:hypothetical protein